MADQLRMIVVDGLSIQVTDQGAQAIEKLQRQLADAMSAAEKEKENKDGQIAALNKSVESRDGEIAALKKSLQDATSPTAIDAAVRQRAVALDAARKAGIADAEKMSDADIRRAVVAKTLGDEAKSMSDDAISGAFSVSVRQLGDSSRIQTGVVHAPNSTTSVADSAYMDHLAHMRDAWKGEKGRAQ